MPELPEVETTRRGLAAALAGRRIAAVRVRERRLRWPLPRGFERALCGATVQSVGRRAKYLLIATDRGTLIGHLGMSGSLRLVAAGAPHLPHDHVEIALESGRCLRFNDPRRFGSLHFVAGDPAAHPLLRHLGVEPLSRSFSAAYLYAQTRRRRIAVKQLLMNQHLVVGVGNIYASEALFRARVLPARAAGRLRHADCARIVAGVRAVLRAALRAGGTTLRDYVGTDGAPGYFSQKLYVYDREGLPCRRCRTPIRRRVQGQRATYWCPHCQR
jgi:formamidopyrimidine-DNA glycosylase